MYGKLIVFAGLIVILAFSMAEKPSIKGNVKSSGKAIRDVDVTIRKVPAGEIVKHSKLKPDGNFSFDDMDNGEYQIEIANIRVDQMSVIEGSILIENNENKEYEVMLFDEHNMIKSSAITNAEGKYFIPIEKAGKYMIHINGLFIMQPVIIEAPSVH